MFRLLISSSALVMMAGSAWAADIVYQESSPAGAASHYEWSGVYVGGNVGYMWNDLRSTNNSITTTGALVGISEGVFDPAATFPGDDGSADLNGAAGGLQAGINFQDGAFVYGIEADYQFADARQSDSFYATDEGPFYETSAQLKHFGTLRGRMGYAADTVLFYGTAGVAFGRAEGNLSVTGGGPSGPVGDTYTDSQSKWLVGYTVGAGVEAAVARTNWTVKAEYLYTDFGSKDFNFSFAGSDGSTATNTSHLKSHMVRLGVNYRF